VRFESDLVRGLITLTLTHDEVGKKLMAGLPLRVTALKAEAGSAATVAAEALARKVELRIVTIG
jgi:hypothetical protein